MIDWDRVAELRDEIGVESFDEVVDLFLTEADEVILRLRPDADRKALESDCHFLKGAALNLGFKTLAAQCQLREMQAARGQDVDDLTVVYQIYQESRQALLAGQAA
jgi:HPt (histidine-containing phosphotransfer) domain-containing protein